MGLTAEKITPLCDEYREGATVNYLCEREGINPATFRWWLRKLQYPIRGRRIHSMDETYFHNIDNQNKAYLLGFIMADGCVCYSGPTENRPNRMFVNISQKDRCILEFMKQELKCSYEIQDYLPNDKTYGTSPMSKLTVNSMEMCDDLAKYGVIPNKTGLERLPVLPAEMMRHFIRGFFDGDGSSYYTKYKGKKCGISIGFVSSKQMLEQLRNLFTSIGVKLRPKISEQFRSDGTSKHLFEMSYAAKKDIEILQKYMYEDANFYLQRKKLD